MTSNPSLYLVGSPAGPFLSNHPLGTTLPCRPDDQDLQACRNPLGGSCSDEMFPHDCQQLPKCGFLTLLYAGRYHLCMSQPPWCFQAACVPPTKSNQCTLVKSNLNIYMSSPNLRSCNSRLGILRHATYRVTSKLWLSYLAFLDLYKQALATEFYLSNRSSPHSPSYDSYHSLHQANI